MILYSVPPSHAPLVVHLLTIERAATLAERRRLIAGLEAEGWTVRYTGRAYHARRGDEHIVMPQRLCPACATWQPLSAYISTRLVEHPWCAACRHARPVEAERKRAALAYRVKQHQPLDDLLGIRRCQNPACPHGGMMPRRASSRGHIYCSAECRAAGKRT